METAYDWITVLLFSGLVVLFLERSLAPRAKGDPMIAYLPAAAGCAATNYLGNQDATLAAVACLVATLSYILFVLRPFRMEH